MGLQFENLVIQNRQKLWSILAIPPAEIIHDGPYFQKKTSKYQGCQIDYLIQSKFNTLYICEIKSSLNPVGLKVIQEVSSKIQKLPIKRNFSIRPILIHINGVSDQVIGEEYFASIISAEQFFK